MIGAEPHLVEAARGGDVAAVERLLVVCQPDLRRFARRACSNGEDAEDAVQIALWQLYRKIGALRAAATSPPGCSASSSANATACSAPAAGCRRSMTPLTGCCSR